MVPFFSFTSYSLSDDPNKSLPETVCDSRDPHAMLGTSWDHEKGLFYIGMGLSSPLILLLDLIPWID